MITANELRIGNWLEGHLGTFFKVDGKILYWFDYGLEKGITEDYKPILLTPEILEKAGFYKKSVNRSINFLGQGLHLPGLSHSVIDITFEEDTESIWVGDIDTKATTLHQLQNIYHALTGEELIIKYL